jgi:hypothetical protein
MQKTNPDVDKMLDCNFTVATIAVVVVATDMLETCGNKACEVGRLVGCPVGKIYFVGCEVGVEVGGKIFVGALLGVLEGAKSALTE